MIVGSSGTKLTDDERAFFASERPWGFILFARNIDTPDQVRALVEDFRRCVDRAYAPVLIDQEGGRVQRLRPPHWTNYPPAASIGALFEQDPDAGKRAAWLMSRLHAFDLSALGINVDCLPVLDVPAEDGHAVIGDRAYGLTAEQVTILGAEACSGLQAGGVMPVIKHIPGHGRARADSHLELPVVETDLATLKEVDFAPFNALSSAPMAMTAHVVYTALDAENPATTSASIISDIIRGEMSFDGLLMSDDVSMQALSGDFGDRTRAIFRAGCDIVLHCNGDMSEMTAVAAQTPELQGLALRRAEDAMRGAGQSDGSQEQDCREEFAGLLGNAVS